MTTRKRNITLGILGSILLVTLVGCAGTSNMTDTVLGKDIKTQRAAGAEKLCPTITAFNVSPLTAECGGEVSLEIAGFTPEAEELSYTWEIEGQTFDGSRVLWKTPTCQTIEEPRQIYTVRGIVSDGECSVTRSVEVKVLCSCAFDFMIHFAFDQSNLDATAKAELNKLGEKLQQYSEYIVLIEGHTDYIGSEPYNKRLGEKRAEVVKQYLLKNWQIASNRLLTRSFGESEPIAPNTTSTGRAKNRRAEVFRIIMNTQ